MIQMICLTFIRPGGVCKSVFDCGPGLDAARAPVAPTSIEVPRPNVKMSQTPNVFIYALHIKETLSMLLSFKRSATPSTSLSCPRHLLVLIGTNLDSGPHRSLGYLHAHLLCSSLLTSVSEPKASSPFYALLREHNAFLKFPAMPRVNC